VKTTAFAFPGYHPGMSTHSSIESLQTQFGITDIVTFEAGEGGLPRIRITSPEAEAHIYLHGAHVSHWQPRGAEPMLFMSGKSWFEAGRPIRGGIPVCWPWFGPHPEHADFPAHGFARLHPWDVEAITQDPAKRVVVTLVLRDNEATRKLWDFPFELRLTLAVGRGMSLRLQTRNVGDKPFTITEALHTYFQVKDVARVKVSGLKNTVYVSKIEGGQPQTQESPFIEFTRETDRVYLNTISLMVLDDPELQRCILLDKQGSNSTVVWNPWIDKAAAMPDFGDDEWPRMVCIETANARDNAVTVAPGATHDMAVSFVPQSTRPRNPV